VRHEGWVHKRGDWRNPTFQRRWFVLEGGVLRYFKAKEDENSPDKAQACLSLREMVVEADAGSEAGPDGKVWCFAFTPGDVQGNEGHHRRILCGCQSESERDAWASALIAACDLSSPLLKDGGMRRGSTIAPGEGDDLRYAAFNILTSPDGINGGRIFCLRVESEEERDEWIEGLLAQVRRLDSRSRGGGGSGGSGGWRQRV